MNHLLVDTLRFLQENFDSETSLTVTPSQIHLKNKTKKIPEPLKSPTTFEPKAPFKPVFKEEKKETPLPPPPTLEKEIIKPSIVPAAPLGVESLSEAVKGLFPQFATHTKPPEDKDLKINPVYKRVLQSDIVLFSFREGKESDLFLQNISLAIGAHFSSAAVLDVKKWELSEGNFDLFFKQTQAKLFIASETLYKKPSLLPFLKEIPSSSERFLGPGKLLLLQPFETYFNNPLQKKELWKNLCAILKKSLPSPASS